MAAGFAVRARLSGNARKLVREHRERGGSLRPAMEAFGAYMLGSTARNFTAQGRRDGAIGVWPGLAPLTIALRPKGQLGAGLAPQILQRTGNLKNSITFAAGLFHCEVGTNVPYAPDHQQGGDFSASKTVTIDRQVPAHTRKAHDVKGHQRRGTGHSQTVKAHHRKAVHVAAHRVVSKAVLPARPFLRFHEADLEVGRGYVRAYITGGRTALVGAVGRLAA